MSSRDTRDNRDQGGEASGSDRHGRRRGRGNRGGGGDRDRNTTHAGTSRRLTAALSNAEHGVTSDGTPYMMDYQTLDGQEITLVPAPEIDPEEVRRRAAAADEQYGGQLQTILDDHGSYDDNGRLVVRTIMETAWDEVQDPYNWDQNGSYIGTDYPPYTQQFIDFLAQQASQQQPSHHDGSQQGGQQP